MPLSKKLSAYPFEFENLARGLARLRKQHKLVLSSYKAAVRFRQQVYGYAGALEHSAETQQRTRPQLASEQRALAEAIRQVEIRLKENVLTFVPRCDSETYHAIQDLLGQLEDTPESQEVFATLHGEEQDQQDRQDLDQDTTLQRLGYVSPRTAAIHKHEDCTPEEMNEEAAPMDLNELFPSQPSQPDSTQPDSTPQSRSPIEPVDPVDPASSPDSTDPAKLMKMLNDARQRDLDDALNEQWPPSDLTLRPKNSNG